MSKKVKYMINLPMQLTDSSGYPSDRLGLSLDSGDVLVVPQDESEAIDSAEDWGYTIFFDEIVKNILQDKFNNSLIIEEVAI